MRPILLPLLLPALVFSLHQIQKLSPYPSVPTQDLQSNWRIHDRFVKNQLVTNGDERVSLYYSKADRGYPTCLKITPRPTFYLGDVTQVIELVIRKRTVPMAVVFGNPGRLGGFVEGSRAQEEHVSRCTNLVQVVESSRDFRRLYKYTAADRLPILARNVLLLRYSEGSRYFNHPHYHRFHAFIDFAIDMRRRSHQRYYGARIVNIAGFNRPFFALNNRGIHLMRLKITRQFSAAREYGSPLIVGAFGSGVYCIDPRQVARLYYDVASMSATGVPLYFAITDPALMAIYQQTFNALSNYRANQRPPLVVTRSR